MEYVRCSFRNLENVDLNGVEKIFFMDLILFVCGCAACGELCQPKDMLLSRAFQG